MAISFATDIRPLFRQKDVSAMKEIGDFDLSSHADVSERADGILAMLKAGRMPCDGAWTADKVQLFADWVKGGKLA